MAIDGNGNWVNDINQAPWTPGTPTGGVFSGVGAPDNSLGVNGNVYIDESTGDIYTKSGDVWTLKSSGSGGATQIYFGAFDDPNGNVTPDDPTKAAIYYKDSEVNIQWRWSINGAVWYQTLG